MHRTFEELGQLVQVVGCELVQVLAGPDRADQDCGAEADGDAGQDGGGALEREGHELLDAAAGDGDEADGEYEYTDTVVEPRLDLREEP